MNLDTPLHQSRPARREARHAEAARVQRYGSSYAPSLHSKTDAYEGMSLVARPQRPFLSGQRSAHFDTLFAFYIDLVTDPSRAKQKDPECHERMRQDLQILGCLNVRKLATIQLRREWTPAMDDPDAKYWAGKFERWFEMQYRPSEMLSNMLDAILDGLSVQEMVWKLCEDDYSFGIDRMFPCYKDRFVFSKDGKLAMLTRRNVFYGDLVHPWQFIKHTYNVGGGSWAAPGNEGRLYWGQGLEDNIYPNYYFKTVVLNLYTRWLQRLASGVLIGRYPEKNPTGRQVAMELLEAYQEDEELAYPSGDEWNVDIHEATRAPADTFLSFIEYMDRQISKAILGSTLIIDQGDVGTQSLGEVHERTTFGRVTEFDRMGIVETINREVVPVMARINRVPEDMIPTFDMPLDETTPAVAQVLEAFQMLQGLGFEISAEMVSEKTGYRQAKPGEKVLNMPMSSLYGEGDLGGFEEEDGEGSPLQDLQLGTPEGMDRFRDVVYRSSNGHHRGRQRYHLATAGLDSPHKHTATLDNRGNGITDRVNGHQHEVRNWKCQTTDSHTHDVLVTSNDLDRVMRCLVGN